MESGSATCRATCPLEGVNCVAVLAWLPPIRVVALYLNSTGRSGAQFYTRFVDKV